MSGIPVGDLRAKRSVATQGSAVNRWISVLGQSMVPLRSLPLSFSLVPVIFSDQWSREKNQWSKVITWRKIQRRPEARPTTWVPFHASAAATQTHSAGLFPHLKQQEQPDAAYPLWPIRPQRKVPDCTEQLTALSARYWSAVLHTQALAGPAIPHFQNAKWQK